MQKAVMVHRLAVACPICRLERFLVRRRLPTVIDGQVENHCVCERCGAQFTYTEDRTGRPLRK